MPWSRGQCAGNGARALRALLSPADQCVVDGSRILQFDRARVLVECVAEETRDPDLLTAASILRTC